MSGKNILEIEVTNVSRFGFWLFIDENELYLPFELFPWFQKASIQDITNVELLNGDHLYWPALDIDLDIDSIIHPDKYPLLYHE